MPIKKTKQDRLFTKYYTATPLNNIRVFGTSLEYLQGNEVVVKEKTNIIEKLQYFLNGEPVNLANHQQIVEITDINGKTRKVSRIPEHIEAQLEERMVEVPNIWKFVAIIKNNEHGKTESHGWATVHPEDKDKLIAQKTVKYRKCEKTGINQLCIQ